MMSSASAMIDLHPVHRSVRRSRRRPVRRPRAAAPLPRGLRAAVHHGAGRLCARPADRPRAYGPKNGFALNGARAASSRGIRTKRSCPTNRGQSLFIRTAIRAPSQRRAQETRRQPLFGPLRPVAPHRARPNLPRFGEIPASRKKMRPIRASAVCGSGRTATRRRPAQCSSSAPRPAASAEAQPRAPRPKPPAASATGQDFRSFGERIEHRGTQETPRSAKPPRPTRRGSSPAPFHSTPLLPRTDSPTAVRWNAAQRTAQDRRRLLVAPHGGADRREEHWPPEDADRRRKVYRVAQQPGTVHRVGRVELRRPTIARDRCRVSGVNSRSFVRYAPCKPPR